MALTPVVPRGAEPAAAKKRKKASKTAEEETLFEWALRDAMAPPAPPMAIKRPALKPRPKSPVEFRAPKAGSWRAKSGSVGQQPLPLVALQAASQRAQPAHQAGLAGAAIGTAALALLVVLCWLCFGRRRPRGLRPRPKRALLGLARPVAELQLPTHVLPAAKLAKLNVR